jgi:polyisoprenoid-binding protein YceI
MQLQGKSTECLREDNRSLPAKSPKYEHGYVTGHLTINESESIYKMKQLLFLIMITTVQLQAQEVHLTRNGKITFFSHTSIEDIQAVNNEVTSTVNSKTGAVQFLVLIKGFQFRKAAMQQHFNSDDYMNSDQYPKADFKGTIKDISKVNLAKDGLYPVIVEGNLTMHGVTNKVTANGSVTVKDGKISTYAKFPVKLAEYKITVPAFTAAKIAQVVDVIVSCSYEPYRN